MRNDICLPGAGELTYEIRAIVEIADKMRALGMRTNMENIGDPVAKGEIIPDWIKEIVSELVRRDLTYAYSPTRGLLATREYLAEQTNRRGGVKITPDDILFFNGLGDAIHKVYGNLNPSARVIGSSPSYSTHSSAETGHADGVPVTYAMNPDAGWLPDLAEIRASVEKNPAISGILIINPDNPTGAVWPAEMVEGIVEIARDFDLFVIADEIYMNLIYNGAETRPISDLIGNVPAIAMKGISKEVPWPGSRCGWIEVYNADKDPAFARYTRSVLNAKMLEVCSTTLPQAAIPQLLSHPEYPAWLDERRGRYARCSQIAYDRLRQVEGLRVNLTRGAFYMSVAFDESLFNSQQTLPVENPDIRALVEGVVSGEGVAVDKRFVYYLLASTGICIVPLSSFATPLRGFRMTLLERDEATFTRIVDDIAEAIPRYLASA